MGKLPAILLYDGDWYKDGVAGCSLGSQGLWLRMMFIGHNSERYGYLQVNGRPIPPDSIARRCGCTLEEYETYLAELDRNGVPSRTPEGIIYSRRMVKDAAKRTKGAERQKAFRNNKNITPPVTPMSVNENVPVVEVGFEVQGFDFSEAFDKLFSIYPRRKKSRIIEEMFCLCVEKVIKRHGFRRSEAAAYILSRTELYVSKCQPQFIAGMDKYLENEIYEQDESMWEQGNGKRSVLDEI